jgi:hypothetical protein
MTLLIAGLDVVNFVLQVVLYRNDDTALLAAVHVATGPVFVLIAAYTVVAGRRLASSHTPKETI